MKFKACPLLVQNDTYPSLTMGGESHSRTYFLECLGERCAAFSGKCERFGTIPTLPEPEEDRTDERFY